MDSSIVTARAHANIALAKYWGKASVQHNMPAVPSISVTLEALSTTTSVAFDDDLTHDDVLANGVHQSEEFRERVCTLLDRVRKEASIFARARVVSSNDFPTASGLASSASAFAALALASVKAAKLPWDAEKISDLARQSSASAARSVFGGFVRLAAGNASKTFLAAEPIAPADYWDLRVVVAIVSEKPKTVGSTRGMIHTQTTSPYFDAWCALCPALASRVELAIAQRDLDMLGQALEQSAFAMHASAMASDPGVVYFEPATIAALQCIRAMRGDGVPAYATMDAGPHVKVVTSSFYASEVLHRLQAVPGVCRTIVSGLGGPAEVLSG